MVVPASAVEREFGRQKSSVVRLNPNENVGAACLHETSERLGWVFCAAVLRQAAPASQGKPIILVVV